MTNALTAFINDTNLPALDDDAMAAAIDASQEEMFGDITIEALVPTDQIRPPGQMSEEVTAA